MTPKESGLNHSKMRRWCESWIAACGIVLLAAELSASQPVIKIGDSTIHGETVSFQNTNVNQYLGIRYAKAPIGKLRFQKPVSIPGYPSTVLARDMPPACPQYTENPFPWYVKDGKKNEDCLFLNVWIPSGGASSKAVLYWMYGGGFRYGSITDPLYSGIALAALGDVIVVTVNYRIGPFGFLSSNTDHAPGNMGVWDCLEGLKWVNKYISFFGGDKERITMAGESAGAIIAGLLSVSPLSEGLYRRLIMQSGSPTYLLAEQTDNMSAARKLTEAVNCSNATHTIETQPELVVECLKGLNTDTIISAYSRQSKFTIVDFMHQFGDEILPENPRISVAKGAFSCKEVLIGTTKDEGSCFLTVANRDTFGFFGEKDANISESEGREMIRQIVRDRTNGEDIIEFYLPQNSTDVDVRHRAFESYGNFMFGCPIQYYAEKCAEQEGKAYFYAWDHRPSRSPWADWMGTAHYEEIQFVFGQPLLHPSRYTEEETQLSRKVIAMWSNFIKTGKPSSTWPEFSRKSPTVRHIGRDAAEDYKSKPTFQKNCEFLRSTFGF